MKMVSGAIAVALVGVAANGFAQMTLGPVSVDVYINEIMVNSIDPGEDAGEYVELYNYGTRPVDIGKWTITDYNDTDTIRDISLPGLETPGTVIPPGGYALIVDPQVGSMYNIDIKRCSDPTKLIIVTVDDAAIGNQLSNYGGTIMIQASQWVYDIWNRKYVKPQLVQKYPSQAAANYDGKSYQYCDDFGVWKLGQRLSPGGANVCY